MPDLYGYYGGPRRVCRIGDEGAPTPPHAPLLQHTYTARPQTPNRGNTAALADTGNHNLFTLKAKTVYLEAGARLRIESAGHTYTLANPFVIAPGRRLSPTFSEKWRDIPYLV